MATISADNKTTTTTAPTTPTTTTTTCSASPPIAPQNRREETCFLTDDDVNEVLGRKFRGGAFRLVDWRLEPLDETKGFLGRYYHLKVTARVDDGTENLRFFVKIPPAEGSAAMEYVDKADAFNREVTVYTDLIPRMDPVGRSEWSAECYLGKRNVIIVLEDASINGYATMDKYVPLDEEHCILLLRTLARFHSRSLILDEKLRRENGGTVLDLYGHLLKEMIFNEENETTELTLLAGAAAINAVTDLVPELDDHGEIVVRRRLEHWIREIPRLLAPSSKRRNVICHRDVWANNLMFRHDPAGKPCGCYLIDFQFFCYCSPVIDFVYTLYLNTDRATRDRHMDAFAKIYYDSFARNLAEEGLDVEECLPWAEFQESCEEARNTALVLASGCLQIMLLSNEATVDYFYNASDKFAEVLFAEDVRANLVRYQCRNVPAYKARFAEIILEIRDRLPEHPPSNL